MFYVTKENTFSGFSLTFFNLVLHLTCNPAGHACHTAKPLTTQLASTPKVGSLNLFFSTKKKRLKCCLYKFTRIRTIPNKVCIIIKQNIIVFIIMYFLHLFDYRLLHENIKHKESTECILCGNA